MEGYDETGTSAQTFVFPEYAIESARLRSFKNWPRGLKQKLHQLADAGFFYTRTSDHVICFSCGGGLSQWEEDDIPWEQHALYYDQCKYMRIIKGNDFHDEVVLKLAMERIEKSKNNTSDETSPPNATSLESESSDGDEKCCEKWFEKLNDSRKCRICYENEYSCVFIPCGHIFACAKCALVLEKCPMCQKTYTNLQKIFFP
ncbi:death-associated inhibitor of apoptosis 1-like [Contarinia nasturtii]|uniref:death-associated inhibitor of apoptosis 1-like n=1 Tax=Contarinia nasturtii TaxID=265458 RepID=UPI0012D372B2|nr:death-associated inhibitor of apoptosis 1-like [Contarinia nasturtii]